MIQIRIASSEDYDGIWEIIEQVIEGGDTYAFATNSSKENMIHYWCGKDKNTYVATIDQKIAGTFIIKNNQPDLGSHIANASYMTLPSASGNGIGKTMGLYSIEESKKLGYKAMQFNLVVKTNERAIKLWQHLGFTIIGEIPEAFNHKTLGYVSAYIMYLKL